MLCIWFLILLCMYFRRQRKLPKHSMRSSYTVVTPPSMEQPAVRKGASLSDLQVPTDLDASSYSSNRFPCLPSYLNKQGKGGSWERERFPTDLSMHSSDIQKLSRINYCDKETNLVPLIVSGNKGWGAFQIPVLWQIDKELCQERRQKT